MYSLLLSFLDEQQANLIICMLISIPLSFLLCLLKQKYLFLALSISITLAFQSFLFPVEKYFLWIQQQIVYLIVMFAPRKYVGHIVFVESFLALAAVQIRRIYLFYAVNGVDITGIFMMQLFVWVGMAYNYQNGIKDPFTLPQDAKKRMIKDRPNYITYLGYVNFLPACLIGPVYEYRDYEDYLHRENDYKDIPNPLKAMGKQFLMFLASLIIYVLTLRFNIEYVLTDQFSSSNLLLKFAYIIISIFNVELKYISAWSLGMISMKASGITYNPTQNKMTKQGKIQEYNFDRVKTTDFMRFYVGPSIKDKAEGWNISVQNALKKYIYEQIHSPTNTYKDEKQKRKTMNKAQLATLMTSAIWHGFYLGYFISFLHWTLCVQISVQFYKLRVRSKKIAQLWQKYTILSIIQNMLWTFMIMYLGTAIHLMIWSRIKVYLYETYAIPYFFLYILWFVIVQLKVLNKIDAKPKQLDKQQKTIKQN